MNLAYKLVNVILSGSDDSLCRKALVAMQSNAEENFLKSEAYDLFEAFVHPMMATCGDSDADATADANADASTASSEPVEHVEPVVVAPATAKPLYESARGSKKRIADHLAKFERAATKDASPVADTTTHAAVDGYRLLTGDDVIQKGDEWRLKAGLKHGDGGKRRWRKASDIGAKVSNFTKSEYRRKA